LRKQLSWISDFSERALNVSGNNAEQAMEWLLAHADDVISDTPAVAPLLAAQASTSPETATKTDESSGAGGSEETPQAASIKCEDCGRLFKTNLEVEFHATKSGHVNFSESTEEKKPLTEEEKKAQLRLIEEKIAKKRAEREEREKQESLEKERMRIKSGKDMTEIRRKLEEDEMKKIVRNLGFESLHRFKFKQFDLCCRLTKENVRRLKRKQLEIV
jgi:UBX domain-containing protein 1/4